MILPLGRPVLWPALYPGIGLPPSTAGIAIDAAGEKVSASGPVYWLDGGTHDIAVIEFHVATCSGGGAGTTFRVSLQDTDATVGAPLRPDGAVDQYYETGTIPTSNSWNVVTLDTPRLAVAHGTMLSLVWDYSAFSTAASVAIARLNTMDSRQARTNSGMGLYTTLWAAQSGCVLALLRSSDGVLGVIADSIPTSPTAATFATTYAPASAADEIGNWVIPREPLRIDGLWGVVGPYTAAGANYDIILYEENAVLLGPYSISYLQLQVANNNILLHIHPVTPTTLKVGVKYRVVFKPTAAGYSIGLYGFPFNSPAHRAFFGGLDCGKCSRADGGAWTDIDTRQEMAGFQVVGVDDGSFGRLGPNFSVPLGSF